jgi:hypothetical protein
LWPKPATVAIDAAITEDDVELLNDVYWRYLKRVILFISLALTITPPAKISDITREIQLVAPWLTDSEARKRVRWCLEIFRAKAFLSVHKAIHAD